MTGKRTIANAPHGYSFFNIPPNQGYWWECDSGERQVKIAYDNLADAEADCMKHFVKSVTNGFSVAPLVTKARRNAAKRGITFSVSENDVFNVLCEQGGCCAVSGVRFDCSKSPVARQPQPWAASIDRIDSDKGYTPRNIRLVCLVVNYALNVWPDSVLFELVKAMTDKLMPPQLPAQPFEMQKVEVEEIRPEPRIPPDKLIESALKQIGTRATAAEILDWMRNNTQNPMAPATLHRRLVRLVIDRKVNKEGIAPTWFSWV